MVYALKSIVVWNDGSSHSLVIRCGIGSKRMSVPSNERALILQSKASIFSHSLISPCGGFLLALNQFNMLFVWNLGEIAVQV